MAITNAQTTKWSATVELIAQEASIISQVASGLYQADAENARIIKTVSVGAPTIGDYAVGTPMTYEQLTDTAVDIPLSVKKFYAFQIDDVDSMQSVPSLENPALIEAGRGLAISADAYAFGNYADATTTVDNATAAIAVTAATISTYIGDAMVTLDGFNAGPDRVLIVSPDVFRLIVEDANATLTNNVDVFATGFIKDYYGFEVFKSNSLSDGIGSAPDAHCLAMTKRAMPFAASISKSRTMELESQFSMGHSGLFVYGSEIKWPNEVVDMFLTVA